MTHFGGDAIVTDELRYFDSNGVKIGYLARGHGEPVVLLHGFVFSTSPAWIEGGFLETLSSANRVVAMDLRGHGQSGKPHDPAGYGLEMVNDVVRLIDHLEFERVHLIGYSLGGILASKFLAVAPQRLRSVVIGGAGWVREGDSTYQSWVPLAELLERVKPGESLSAYFWPNAAERPPREIQQMVDANDSGALAAVARGMLDVTVGEEVLRSNRVPMLAVCGALDPVKPSVLAMKAIARNLTIRVVQGLDHHSLPGSKKFRDLSRKFISRHKGSDRAW